MPDVVALQVVWVILHERVAAWCWLFSVAGLSWDVLPLD
jgi:hypothetical protein